MARRRQNGCKTPAKIGRKRRPPSGKSGAGEEWSRGGLRRGEGGCCVLIGPEQRAPVCRRRRAVVYNCVGFIKPAGAPVIVLILPWPLYLGCLYLVLWRLFLVTSDD